MVSAGKLDFNLKLINFPPKNKHVNILKQAKFLNIQRDLLLLPEWFGPQEVGTAAVLDLKVLIPTAL